MVATPSRRYEVHSKVPAVRPLCVDTPDLFPIGGPVKGRFVAVPILDWLAILVIGNGANASVDHIAFISKTRVGKLVVIGCTVDARWMPAKTSISEVLSKVPDSSLGRLPPSKLSKRVTVELEEGSWGAFDFVPPEDGSWAKIAIDPAWLNTVAPRINGSSLLLTGESWETVYPVGRCCG